MTLLSPSLEVWDSGCEGRGRALRSHTGCRAGDVVFVVEPDISVFADATDSSSSSNGGTTLRFGFALRVLASYAARNARRLRRYVRRGPDAEGADTVLPGHASDPVSTLCVDPGGHLRLDLPWALLVQRDERTRRLRRRLAAPRRRARVVQPPLSELRRLRLACDCVFRRTRGLPCGVGRLLRRAAGPWAAHLVVRVACALRSNAFAVAGGGGGGGGGGGEGFALYPVASLLNHSCAPNLARARVGPGLRSAAFVALRDVEAGEELQISYVCVSRPGARRRAALRAAYGFDCCCERCGVGGDEDPAPALPVCARCGTSVVPAAAVAETMQPLCPRCDSLELATRLSVQHPHTVTVPSL